MSVRKGIGQTLKFGNGWQGRVNEAKVGSGHTSTDQKCCPGPEHNPSGPRSRQATWWKWTHQVINYRLTPFNITFAACQTTFCSIGFLGSSSKNVLAKLM